MNISSKDENLVKSNKYEDNDVRKARLLKRVIKSQLAKINYNIKKLIIENFISSSDFIYVGSFGIFKQFCY